MANQQQLLQYSGIRPVVPVFDISLTLQLLKFIFHNLYFLPFFKRKENTGYFFTQIDNYSLVFFDLLP
jgi:hypothetical protein